MPRQRYQGSAAENGRGKDRQIMGQDCKPRPQADDSECHQTLVYA